MPRIVDRIQDATAGNLAALRGGRILRVAYSHSDRNWPANYRLDSKMHEPDAAVRLDTSVGAFIITWEMFGHDELLTFSTVREADEREIRLPSHETEVSTLDPWPRLMNDSVTEALMLSDGWSDATMRLKLGGGVVDFSLGEWDGGGCRYIPNSLLVEFRSA